MCSLTRRACQKKTTNIQYGPRKPIYQQWLHRPLEERWCKDHYGWEGKLFGQHLCGTALAVPKIRRSLLERLRIAPGGKSKNRGLDTFLQFWAPPSIAQLPHTMGGVPEIDPRTSPEYRPDTWQYGVICSITCRRRQPLQRITSFLNFCSWVRGPRQFKVSVSEWNCCFISVIQSASAPFCNPSSL